MAARHCDVTGSLDAAGWLPAFRFGFGLGGIVGAIEDDEDDEDEVCAEDVKE